MKDIIIISIDCWRHDAISNMPRTRGRLEHYEESKLICHSPYTAGAFPTLLASNHAWDVFEDGNISNETVSLPGKLSTLGYSTGGFVAGNPFLNDWSTEFDNFWNAGYCYGDTKTNKMKKVGGYLHRLLSQRQEVPAEVVFRRARDWRTSQTSPTFTWIHLMEPHSPYHPGLVRARELGLLKSYYANLEYKFTEYQTAESLTKFTQNKIEQLYWKCIELLDCKISSFVDKIPENTTVLLLGDHGEEFNKGVYGHARLYDETVLVPFLSRWTISEQKKKLSYVQQIDLAPTIVDRLGGSIPDSWSGIPFSPESRPAYMWSAPNVGDYIYAGIRTEKFKIIRNLDREMRPVNIEVYDLQSDPDESEDISHRNPRPDLIDSLDDWTTEEHNVEFLSGMDTHAQGRLEALGYR